MTGGGGGNKTLTEVIKRASSICCDGLILRRNTTLGINLKTEDETGKASIMMAFCFIKRPV